MNKIKNIIAISVFSLMVLALPSVATAQWGGNGGYFPGGRNVGNLEGVAERLKDRSRDFERQVDRDRFFNNRGGILGGILNGRNRGYSNANLRRLAEDFRRAAAEFENRVDGGGNNRRDNYRDLSRGEQAAQRMLGIGQQIDRELNFSRANPSLRSQWNAIENDLRLVANAYRYNNRGGRNGRWPF
jgi:hypothetical protein